MQHNSKITTLAGHIPSEAQALAPFSALVIDFLAALSKSLLTHREAKTHADVAAFAFWCRKSNLKQLQQRFEDPSIRLGRGLVFHIAPGNVPVNFAYSFAFGLLAGNANIIRLPSKASPSQDFIIAAISSLFADKKYTTLAHMSALVRYEHTPKITAAFSARCDARMIWGGDTAIADIRKAPIGPRTIEITFADRYSFCVMCETSVAVLDSASLKALAQAFYNDAYQMDQNACSSPHLIVWLNACAGAGKDPFWAEVKSIAKQNYTLEPVQAVDKYTRMLSNFVEGPDGQRTLGADTLVTRLSLQELDKNMDQLRGVFGLFYEYDAKQMDDVAHIVNNKYQTLTYFGLEPSVLGDFVTNNHLSGIDRIVPVGTALSVDTIWDGIDILKTLSRIIDVK